MSTDNLNKYQIISKTLVGNIRKVMTITKTHNIFIVVFIAILTFFFLDWIKRSSK